MARPPVQSDNVTDDQWAAMRQAISRMDGEPWVGDMSAALECCDRGWLSTARLPEGLQDGREGVFYLITVSGAAVVRREQRRRQDR